MFKTIYYTQNTPICMYCYCVVAKELCCLVVVFLLRSFCVVVVVLLLWSFCVVVVAVLWLWSCYVVVVAVLLFFRCWVGLGDMTISYRGRYESVYRERFGHIVYTEREKKRKRFFFSFFYIALHWLKQGRCETHLLTWKKISFVLKKQFYFYHQLFAQHITLFYKCIISI